MTAYNLDTCPKTILTAGPNNTPIQETVFVPPNCVADLFFFEDAQGDKLNIQGSEVEVQATAPGGLPSGVLLYSRTTNTGQSVTEDVLNSCCYVRTEDR